MLCALLLGCEKKHNHHQRFSPQANQSIVHLSSDLNCEALAKIAFAEEEMKNYRLASHTDREQNDGLLIEFTWSEAEREEILNCYFMPKI